MINETQSLNTYERIGVTVSQFPFKVSFPSLAQDRSDIVFSQMLTLDHQTLHRGRHWHTEIEYMDTLGPLVWDMEEGISVKGLWTVVHHSVQQNSFRKNKSRWHSST